jgi:hypothetical protein
MSFGTMSVGIIVAVAVLLAVSGQAALASTAGAGGSAAWPQADHRSLTHDGGADLGTVVLKTPDTTPEASGPSTGSHGALTIKLAPEFTTWATLALAVAPLGAAARLRRRRVSQAMSA